jgi:hypothetical protein
MLTNKGKWVFSPAELNKLNQIRHIKLPLGFSPEDEKKLINYQTFLLKELFKSLENVQSH